MNQLKLSPKYLLILASVSVLALLAACGTAGTPTPQTFTATPAPPQPSSTPTATATATPEPPTPTPEPLAVRVGEQGITVAEYQAELQRFQSAAAADQLTAEQEARVLDDLVDRLLLAQAAFEAGIRVSEAELDQRLEQLATDAGGEQALMSWLAANAYSLETFRQALARDLAAAWMRDQIAADVPETAEQVRVRQILLYNSEEAQQVYDRIQSGTDFATVAAELAPTTLGDLGWFPRGYLLEPEIEQAAFSLQPDEVSSIIQTRLGFHILQLVDRQADRPLEPDARLHLQIQAVSDWLLEQRQGSDIQVFVP